MGIGPKLAEGREAEVFAWNDGAVLKLYRPGYEAFAAEAAALNRLAETGIAPRLFDMVLIDDRHGLVLQRLGGTDMLAQLQRQPWRLSRLAAMLAQAMSSFHALTAPQELPVLNDVLAERIKVADLEPRLRESALRVLASLPVGDRLCHGDFHPGNAIVASDQVRIIDWASASRGVPAADFARTLLLLRQADPLPGTPLSFRLLLAVGRSAFAGGFARAYRRHTTSPLLNLEKWTVVNAAARLAEGLSAETARLTGIVKAGSGE